MGPGAVARGFTLVELMISAGIIGLLTSILAPCLDEAIQMARLIRCTGQMHGVGRAMLMYAGQSNLQLPPFAFSDMSMDLTLSGHWGGSGQAGNPDLLGQHADRQLNLQVLVGQGLLGAGLLICPSAPAELHDGTDSWFATSRQFSTYCLRMPLSEDLFAGSPQLLNHRKMGPLGVYWTYSGGQLASVKPYPQRVPLVRLDMSYKLLDELLAAGDYDSDSIDPARDVLMADAFWFQAAASDHRGRAVQRAWCHGRRFNAMRGDGSVRRRQDDGTIAGHVQTPGQPKPWDGLYYASHSEYAWQYLGRRD